VSVAQAARGKLDLGGIGMTVVPLEVFKQFDLKALWLHENGVQEIAPEIADLTALTQLRVNNNELRVLPAAGSQSSRRCKSCGCRTTASPPSPRDPRPHQPHRAIRQLQPAPLHPAPALRHHVAARLAR